MKFCLIDFETASACDLKKAGAWVYAGDPTTEVLCLGYTIDGNTPVVLGPHDLGFGHDALSTAASDAGVVFVAHNAGFEKAVWRKIMVPVFGWPDIPNDRWHDSMAVCAMKGLPLNFEKAVKVLGLPAEKDMEGRRATLAMSRTNRKGYHERTGEKMDRVLEYNRRDVAGELGLHRRVRGLGAQERRVWLLDQEINERGVRLDRAYIEAAIDICRQATGPLLNRFQEVTGLGKPGSPKFKDWLAENGLQFPADAEGNPDTSLDKEHMEVLLGADPPQICREALEIRSTLGSASIKKLPAMIACLGPDDRARGLLQYHGAGPGRWSGRLLQPQNFPRGKMDTTHDPEQLVSAIMTRDAEYVRALYGEPVAAVATGLRHALCAAPGHLLEAGDFAAVEARIVLALAGSRKALSIFRDPDRDVYCEMAATIFNVPAPVGRDAIKQFKIDNLELRQTGKNTILGCGFGMGRDKFRDRYAKDKPIEFAASCIDAYRKDFAPEVPVLWRDLERAATRTVWDRTPNEAFGVVYSLEDGWLTARLHSGKKLWYYDPRPSRNAMPWDETDVRPCFTYGTWKAGRWVRVDAYGGLLTENVVQATARELLVHSMFNCKAAGHNTVLTVHDEIINEVPEADADADYLARMMCDAPDWAEQIGISVDAECWVGERYRK